MAYIFKKESNIFFFSISISALIKIKCLKQIHVLKVVNGGILGQAALKVGGADYYQSSY